MLAFFLYAKISNHRSNAVTCWEVEFMTELRRGSLFTTIVSKVGPGSMSRMFTSCLGTWGWHRPKGVTSLLEQGGRATFSAEQGGGATLFTKPGGGHSHAERPWQPANLESGCSRNQNASRLLSESGGRQRCQVCRLRSNDIICEVRQWHLNHVKWWGSRDLLFTRVRR